MKICFLRIITSCSIRYYGLVVIIEMLGGESFPKRLGGGFVEREGWEATAVSAVTGTNNCSHHPCNGMVCLVTQSKSLEVERNRGFKRGRKSRIGVML